ncbi:hypothetical protein EPJ79_03710 [Brachyspira aalborgi]|uniref:Glycosyltransferase RgtA/B/C/D-like domain-containing protein n=1 Tax=Brachyspira aalborgi TaxID=29522 RepID=A0A5C8D4Z3_9SPIR|nr:hypothetical protein [Brachyspira aalborgi]TXJ20266.1 hypothetical protein EPJ79_03710 [Brachyspira aalborgi]
MKSKNKNLFLKIYIPFVIITIITLIVLQILGSKNRIGYLSDFSLVVDKTMKLNNSENITNYVYHFRIRYYDKTFRNNDIYGVYPDLSNLPDFVKEIKMDYFGSPFGIFISDKKIIEEDKIDNINYTLKIKKNIIEIIILLHLSILIIFIMNNIKIYYYNKFYNLINKKYILYSFLFLILSFSLFVRIYWASKQEGMYWDEYYSLSAANYKVFANEDKINNYKNIKGFDILKDLTFDNSSIEDCINDIKRLYKDTNDPFISNLYYTFLRLAFIGREAVDIKNIIITGTILNCIFSIISFIFLFKILKLIFENKNEFIIFTLLIFSLSPISISFSMFLRAYQMQETFFIVITYFVLNTIYYNKYSILNLILTSIIAGIGYLTLYSSLLFILILSAMLFFNYCLNIDKLEFLKNKYAILNPLLKIKSYKIIIYYALAFISALFVSRILYNSFFASLFNANNRASSSLAFSGKLFNYINDLAFDGLLIILLTLFVFILISKIIKKKDLNIIAEKSKFKLLIFIILLGLIFAILGDLTSPYKLERYSASSYIFILFFIPLIICFITNLKIRIILLSLISIIYIFNITNSKRFVYFEVVDKDKYVLTNNYNVYAYKSFINYYDFHYLNTNLYYSYLNDRNELNSIKENNFYLMIDYKDIDKIKNELTDYNFNYLNNVGEINIFELNKKFN